MFQRLAIPIALSRKQMLRDLRRVIPGKTSVAKACPIGVYDILEAVQFQKAKRIRPGYSRNFFDGVFAGHEIIPGGDVGAVIAGP